MCACVFEEGVCCRVERTEGAGGREREREEQRERDAAPVRDHLRRRFQKKTEKEVKSL